MSKTNTEDVVIEGHGIRLAIPEKYVLKKRFWWIDQVDGLDSNEGSIVIQIPAYEIKSLLPEVATQGSSAPHALTATVTVFGQQKASNVAQANNEIASELNQRKGRFSEAFVTYDEVTGWYRLYQSPRIKSRWYVLLHSPDDTHNKRPLKAEDVIALCGRYKSGDTNCNLMTFIRNGVGVETSIKVEHLPYYKKVQEYISSLLQHWLVTGS